MRAAISFTWPWIALSPSRVRWMAFSPTWLISLARSVWRSTFSAFWVAMAEVSLISWAVTWVSWSAEAWRVSTSVCLVVDMPS
ncbi:hypothetical protein ACN28S_16845 [Cystobacter fuscus]